MSQRCQIGRQPVFRLEIDDHVLAELPARVVEVGVDLVGGEVALGHLDELVVGTWLDAADGAVARDVAHCRLDALDHQREFTLRLDEAVLARAGAGKHPRLTGLYWYQIATVNGPRLSPSLTDSAAICVSGRNCSRCSL